MSLYASLRVSPCKKRICTSSDDETTPKRRRLANVLVSLPAPRPHPAQATPPIPVQTPPSIAFPPCASRKHTPQSPACYLSCPCHLRSRSVRTDRHYSQCSTTSPLILTLGSPQSSTSTASSASARSESGTPCSSPRSPRTDPIHSLYPLLPAKGLDRRINGPRRQSHLPLPKDSRKARPCIRHRHRGQRQQPHDGRPTQTNIACSSAQSPTPGSAYVVRSVPPPSPLILLRVNHSGYTIASASSR